MTQPVAYCFFGQHLTNKFEELYINVLEVRWYHFKGEEKRSYLIMLQNMQQPVVVRTPFNELSVVVFRNVRGTFFTDFRQIIYQLLLQIINSAYSFYAVITKMAS